SAAGALQRVGEHVVDEVVERVDVFVGGLFNLGQALHRISESRLDAGENGAAGSALADNYVGRGGEDVVDSCDIIPGVGGHELHLFEKLTIDELPLDLRIFLQA